MLEALLNLLNGSAAATPGQLCSLIASGLRALFIVRVSVLKEVLSLPHGDISGGILTAS